MKRRTALQLRRYGRSVAILIVLMVVGCAAGFYILLQQRLPNPFQSFYAVNGAFPTAAAVVPGLGEPVNVAGVHVGEITNTTLKGGQGIIHMQIDPKKMPRIYNNAHAALVPNTPLMDMQVDIAPGSRSAGVLRGGGTIPVGQSTSPINADELLGSLDTDTRTWLASLITELDNGTKGRGQDLRKLFSTLSPTAVQLRTIGDLLASRRHELATLVHNLGALTQATSTKDAQIRQVIDAGNTTITAIAAQDSALRASLQQLPGTLSTTRSTLADLVGFSDQLAPTATALIPTARRLPVTLRDTATVVKGAAVLPLDQIRSFESAVIPLAGQLPSVTTNLRRAVPALTSSFRVLNYATNELGYNQGKKNPGFLYWLAWFAHNADSFLSTADANGPAWRSLILTTCPSLETLSFGKLLQALVNTSFGCASTGNAR